MSAWVFGRTALYRLPVLLGAPCHKVCCVVSSCFDGARNHMVPRTTRSEGRNHRAAGAADLLAGSCLCYTSDAADEL